jgi:hypothetical protein
VIGDDNRMFTNNHCLATQGKLEDTEIWFNYQRTTCGGSTNAVTVKVTGKDLLKTDDDLNYSLFTGTILTTSPVLVTLVAVALRCLAAMYHIHMPMLSHILYH